MRRSALASLALSLMLGTSFTPALAAETGRAVAVFAGGCFWSMQHAFDDVPGVIETTAGYSGGTVANPSYAQVSTGTTGHLESVKVVYDPAKVSYDGLLDVYWHSIDPMAVNAQFCDRGTEYQSAIFTGSPEEAKTAQASKAEVAKELGEKVATEIRPVQAFYPAEAYHQHFATTNPLRYKAYRIGCGRDARTAQIWGSAVQPHQ